jgi:hypothetical protein
MKAYAMLLGLLFTVGSGYAAQVAVSSVGASGSLEAAPALESHMTNALDTIWYGGVLDPITVEARGDGPAKTEAARKLLLDRPTTRCSQASPAYRAVL